MQFDEHFNGPSPLQRHKTCVEDSAISIVTVLFCFGENMEQKRTDEQGSLLAKSIKTCLAQLLKKAQTHNKIRQMVAVGLDGFSKEPELVRAARPPEANIRSFIAART